MAVQSQKEQKRLATLYFYPFNTSKMKWLILIPILLIGCKKNDTPTLNNSSRNELQLTSNNIGLELETKYLYDGINGGIDSIVFHSNGTITEYHMLTLGLKSYKDTTYKIEYIISKDNSTSILKDGICIKYYIPNNAGSNDYAFYDLLKWNDTANIGTYLQGDIVKNNKPTLGIKFRVKQGSLIK